MQTRVDIYFAIAPPKRRMPVGRWLRMARKSPTKTLQKWAWRWYSGCFDHVCVAVPAATLSVGWSGTVHKDTRAYRDGPGRRQVAVSLSVPNFDLPKSFREPPQMRLWSNVRRIRSGGFYPAWNCVTAAIDVLNAAGLAVPVTITTPDELFAHVVSRFSPAHDNHPKATQRLPGRDAGVVG